MKLINLPIPVDDRVPDGYRLIVAYASESDIVIPIEPEEEENHNCDVEGCGTLEHVKRFSLGDIK